MEWILEYRERVRVDLASAQADERLAEQVYHDACGAYEAAQAHRRRVDALLRALDEIDPSTRTPELPL